MIDGTPLPHWVARTERWVEPFDGDRISRSIFAATEPAGRPDAFLARELTDGVLHFLSSEGFGDVIALGDLRDAIVKVVRELGHPVLARAIESRIYEVGVRSSVFGFRETNPDWRPDLLAAERDGLLHFFDRGTAPRLAGVVLSPSRDNVADGWIDAVESASEKAGQFVALDSPEFSPLTPKKWARDIANAVANSGRRAVVNLNTAEPPSWAMTIGARPQSVSALNEESFRRHDVAVAIAEALFELSAEGIRVDWHLGEADFLPAFKESLPRLAAWAAAGSPQSFVLDRRRRPVALAEGLDRHHPAVLDVVGVGLPALLKKVSESSSAAETVPDIFLNKLGSLVRLALAAGHARRTFLRQHGPPAITAEFLLDRSRLMVVPIGLDEVVQSTGTLLSGPDLETAQNILLGLVAALQRDSIRVPAFLGGTMRLSAGQLSPRQQLRNAAAVQTAIGAGKAEIMISTPAADEIAELLRYAWPLPGLGRFTLRNPRQKLAGW